MNISLTNSGIVNWTDSTTVMPIPQRGHNNKSNTVGCFSSGCNTHKHARLPWKEGDWRYRQGRSANTGVNYGQKNRTPKGAWKNRIHSLSSHARAIMRRVLVSRWFLPSTSAGLAAIMVTFIASFTSYSHSSSKLPRPLRRNLLCSRLHRSLSLQGFIRWISYLTISIDYLCTNIKVDRYSVTRT